MADKISRLEKLYQEMVNDFHIDIMNLHEKKFQIINAKIKWCKILVDEEKRLRRLQETVDQMIDMYIDKNKSQRGGELKAKLDAENVEDIVKLRKEIIREKDIIRFLTLAMDTTVKPANWDLKNIIEAQKLENV